MKSIIFNQHQVNYALKNKEGMFRVVVKNAIYDTPIHSYYDSKMVKPKFQVGETIFVKESFSFSQYSGDDSVRYWANGKLELAGWSKPKPPQHMKQEYSRLTLKIKSVKVERLQDISKEDCLKEGLWWDIENHFATFWNSTHKKLKEKWEASPWVFVYEYEVMKND